MANYGQIPSNIAMGAGVSIRRNAEDDAFEAYNPASVGSDYPRNAFLFFGMFTKVEAGSWALVSAAKTVISGNAENIDPFNASWYQYPQANGDSASCDVLLEEGTYNVTVWGRKANNVGIVDWEIGGSAFMTSQDWYIASNPDGYGAVFTDTVAVGVSGHHKVIVTIVGKNASSSDYYWLLTAVQFVKQ